MAVTFDCKWVSQSVLERRVGVGGISGEDREEEEDEGEEEGPPALSPSPSLCFSSPPLSSTLSTLAQTLLLPWF